MALHPVWFALSFAIVIGFGFSVVLILIFARTHFRSHIWEVCVGEWKGVLCCVRHKSRTTDNGQAKRRRWRKKEWRDILHSFTNPLLLPSLWSFHHLSLAPQYLQGKLELSPRRRVVWNSISFASIFVFGKFCERRGVSTTNYGSPSKFVVGFAINAGNIFKGICT